MIILAGRGSVCVDGERTPVTRGDMLVIPGGREHVVSCASDRPMSWLALYWPLHESAES